MRRLRPWAGGCRRMAPRGHAAGFAAGSRQCQPTGHGQLRGGLQVLQQRGQQRVVAVRRLDGDLGLLAAA